MGSRALACVVVVSCLSCSTHWRANFIEPVDYAKLNPEAAFLKAHLRDGSVYVLENWSVSQTLRVISGQGLRYDLSRLDKDWGRWELAFDEVSLLETNQPENVVAPGLVVLGVITGVTLAVTAGCIAAPKACFGSCPTFYERPDGPILAEGFSSSIARTLEATDVDALPAELAADGGSLSLWMKNEALETHVVRSVRVLAAPLGEANSIVRGGDQYFPVLGASAPATCRAESGDCSAQVAVANDRAEYRSETDAQDLALPEQLQLVFAAAPAGHLGVVVRARSSLVETYAFYQLMAYLGARADDWFLSLESRGEEGKALVESVVGMLGRIEVEVKTTGGYRHAGTFREVGPLAFDAAVIPVDLALPPGPVTVRLTMAKGAWKIDQVGLVALGEPVAAVPVEVSQVSKRGEAFPTVARELRDRSAPLVTYPGDAYRFDFEIPAGRQQLFLETRGYYYEWQRRDWLREADSGRFVDAVWNPAGYFKRIAPAYKALEPRIEELFWNSRVEAR